MRAVDGTVRRAILVAGLLSGTQACGGSAASNPEPAPAVSNGGSSGGGPVAGAGGRAGAGQGTGGSDANGGTGVGTTGGAYGSAGTPSPPDPGGGAAGEPSWDFERPVCGGSRSEGSDRAFCASPIVISEPLVMDSDGNGSVVPGELVRVVLTMTNLDEDHHSYPCLGIAAQSDSVSVPLAPDGSALENPIFGSSYAMLSGGTENYDFYVHFGENVAPGSELRFLAWADSLHAGCTNSGEVEFEISVE